MAQRVNSILHTKTADEIYVCEVLMRAVQILLGKRSLRFELFQKGGKICIQFIHNQNITYTLKVVKNAMVTFEEGRCDSVSDGNILFDETRMGRLYQYKYLAVNRTMCLGVLNDCNYNLALISTTNDNTDGRCLFKKHRSKLSATKRRPSFFIKK
ncbi:unnamed protein product [Pocillopora meandrina]|uniref:Uncharacterized protein n=1 Tax=Pocillopora meandrina TaxID=46732 RepID=A0AAU9XSI4_9CNID|nr:unnamed protein product [Pocillopora meandrina]